MNDPDIVVAVLASTSVILVLIAIVIISVIASAQNRIKQQMKLTEAHLSYEKELRKVELEISEQMMVQFSQELHDNIGHILTSMRITIENKKLDNPEFAAIFPPIEGYLDDATQQLRLLSRSLNKEYIANQGLISAIQIETERIRQLRRFQIHLTAEPQQTGLDKNQELVVFRIFQEVMQNSIKHAKAKNVYIALKSEPMFELEIYDDGEGFDYANTIHSPAASGLKNISRRAQMANMDCSVDASPGRGCRYILKQK